MFIQGIIVRLHIVELLTRIDNVYIVAKIALRISTFLNSNSKHTVLCIGRPGFNEDIASMYNYSSNINYVIIPKTVFTSIFNVFFSSVSYRDIHVKYYERDDLKICKYEYQKYINRLLDVLFKGSRFSAIASGNYVYAWQQEIAAACLARGVPFIVLHKEGMTTKNDYNNLVETYTNNNFIGSKLLVYNDNIREAFVNSKIKGLNKTIVEVSGVPRLDKYFKINQKGKDVVFFSFFLEDKIRHIDLSDEKKKESLEIAKKFHIEVMRLSISNKNINIIIKTKEGNKYYQYVKKMAKENGFLNLRNLVITNKGSSFDLIKKSSCVIGFNSTTLVEGVIAKKTIISPNFAKYGILDFFEKFQALVNYAADSKDLNNYVRSEKKYEKKLESDRMMFLKEYINSTDGFSSRLSEKLILNLIRK